MKILCVGDLHIRSKNPENRIDDFKQTQFDKIKQALEFGRENNCKLCIFPGDMWDNPYPSNELMSEYISLFKEYCSPSGGDVRFEDDDYMLILTVLGQHDMTMRSLETYKKSPSYLLESAGVLTIVGVDRKPGFIDGVIGYAKEDIYGLAVVHGLSFGQDDSHINPVEGEFNILIAHASVGNTGFQNSSAIEFLTRYKKMDLIVVGDYHYPFHSSICDPKQRHIINCGCIVRKTISKEDLELKPSVAIFDTDIRSYQMMPLKIKKPEEVFYIPADAKIQNPAIIRFLESLRTEKALSADYMENLNSYFDKAKTKKEVINYIGEKQ